jgi:hypothetical protein
MSIRVISLLIAVIASVTAVHGSVPIIVSGGAGRRVAMNFSNKAEKQLENGDSVGAKRNVDAALHADPKFWPALYQRASIFACSESDDPECDLSGSCYLPIRIKMPAASARIPMIIVGMVTWKRRVIPARIR